MEETLLGFIVLVIGLVINSSCALNQLAAAKRQAANHKQHIANTTTRRWAVT